MGAPPHGPHQDHIHPDPNRQVRPPVNSQAWVNSGRATSHTRGDHRPLTIVQRKEFHKPPNSIAMYAIQRLHLRQFKTKRNQSTLQVSRLLQNILLRQ